MKFREVQDNDIVLLGYRDKVHVESLHPDASVMLCNGEEAARQRRIMIWTIFVLLVVVVILTGVVIWFSQHLCTPVFSCPRFWLAYEAKCFYFSEMEANWTSSQDDCSALGASLAVIQSKEELDFVLRYKGPADHWIGLSRQDLNQPWEWVDGTQFDSSVFPIGGGERFAFLNDQKVTSARSGGERHWICTKLPAGST